MKGKKGYVMAGAGFFMIIVNALDYLLGWDIEFTPLLIIGLVLVVVGMNMDDLLPDLKVGVSA
ncbi:hypothetical protein GOV09_06365 [Candidatus Woesearchaeota archaeon]|nr:hypothetical protein [Candidatus Woesearchaeota archaeon]